MIAKALGGKGVVSMHTGKPQATTQAIRIKAAQAVLNKYPGIKQLQVIGDATPDAAYASTGASLVGNSDIGAIFDESGGCVQEQKAVIRRRQEGGRGLLRRLGSAGPAAQGGEDRGSRGAARLPGGTLAVQYGHAYIAGDKSMVKQHVQLKDVLVTSANANKPQFQQVLKDGGGS